MKTLITKIVSYLEEDSDTKRLFIFNAVYTGLMISLVVYIYLVCQKAEFDILTQKSITFWQFIKMSNINKEFYTILLNNSISNFSIILIVSFTLLGLVTGILLTSISIYVLFDLGTSGSIDNVKLTVMIYCLVVLLNIFLYWILAKYFFIFLFIILVIILGCAVKLTMTNN